MVQPRGWPLCSLNVSQFLNVVNAIHAPFGENCGSLTPTPLPGIPTTFVASASSTGPTVGIR
jgi:hypothetical protein